MAGTPLPSGVSFRVLKRGRDYYNPMDVPLGGKVRRGPSKWDIRIGNAEDGYLVAISPIVWPHLALLAVLLGWAVSHGVLA